MSEREGYTTKLELTDPKSGDTYEGYITLTFSDDPDRRLPRDVFIHGFGQLGSTLNEWTDTFAILLSLLVQSDGDVIELARLMQFHKFDPYGATNNPDIPKCLSVPDFVLRLTAVVFRHEGLLALYAKEAKQLGTGD